MISVVSVRWASPVAPLSSSLASALESLLHIAPRGVKRGSTTARQRLFAPRRQALSQQDSRRRRRPPLHLRRVSRPRKPARPRPPRTRHPEGRPRLHPLAELPLLPRKLLRRHPDRRHPRAPQLSPHPGGPPIHH